MTIADCRLPNAEWRVAIVDRNAAPPPYRTESGKPRDVLAIGNWQSAIANPTRPVLCLCRHTISRRFYNPMMKDYRQSLVIILGACIALTVMFAGSSFSRPITANQATHPKTIILMRHAEKMVVPPENKDPDLSAAGEARAKEIARMFGGSGITAIYATQFKRTQQTVKPLAERLKVAVTIVEAKKTSDLVAQIRARGPGETIFIAGHNNTVPEIIAALGGPSFPIIPETEFDNLYILTITADGAAKLVKMKFGNPLPVSGQEMPKP